MHELWFLCFFSPKWINIFTVTGFPLCWFHLNSPPGTSHMAVTSRLLGASVPKNAKCSWKWVESQSWGFFFFDENVELSLGWSVARVSAVWQTNILTVLSSSSLERCYLDISHHICTDVSLLYSHSCLALDSILSSLSIFQYLLCSAMTIKNPFILQSQQVNVSNIRSKLWSVTMSFLRKVPGLKSQREQTCPFIESSLLLYSLWEETVCCGSKFISPSAQRLCAGCQMEPRRFSTMSDWPFIADWFDNLTILNITVYSLLRST